MSSLAHGCEPTFIWWLDTLTLGKSGRQTNVSAIDGPKWMQDLMMSWLADCLTDCVICGSVRGCTRTQLSTRVHTHKPEITRATAVMSRAYGNVNDTPSQVGIFAETGDQVSRVRGTKFTKSSLLETWSSTSICWCCNMPVFSFIINLNQAKTSHDCWTYPKVLLSVLLLIESENVALGSYANWQKAVLQGKLSEIVVEVIWSEWMFEIFSVVPLWQTRGDDIFTRTSYRLILLRTGSNLFECNAQEQLNESLETLKLHESVKRTGRFRPWRTEIKRAISWFRWWVDKNKGYIVTNLPS